MKEERLVAVNELLQRSELDVLRAELGQQHQRGCLGRFRRLIHELDNGLDCGQETEDFHLGCCPSR